MKDEKMISLSAEMWDAVSLGDGRDESRCFSVYV